MNRTAWSAYQGMRSEIEQAEADLKEMKQPPRVPWEAFADAVLLANESAVKQHSEYPDAKASDDAVAAANLVNSLVDENGDRGGTDTDRHSQCKRESYTGQRTCLGKPGA